MTDKITYYKMLNEDGSAPVGVGSWNLPKGKRPGKWMPPITDLRMCARGYHLARTAEEVLAHRAAVVYVAEVRGTVIDGDDQCVVSEARLIRRVMGPREWRLFAVDCAERVLPIFEAKYPKDKRPRHAIEVARGFAEGKATANELVAAGDAAGVAARVAAWDAAEDAAWDAARVAAWVAARDAARVAAWDAEREWQIARLAWYLGGKS